MLHTFQKNNSPAVKHEVLSSSRSTGVGARNSWILILPLNPIPSLILSELLNPHPSVSQSRTGIMLLTYQTFLLGMFWRLVFAECFEDEITNQSSMLSTLGQGLQLTAIPHSGKTPLQVPISFIWVRTTESGPLTLLSRPLEMLALPSIFYYIFKEPSIRIFAGK